MVDRRVPILMYHRLGEVREDSIVPGQYVSATLFDRQLRLLSALGMTTIGLKALHEAFQGHGKLPKRPIVVTFDDGYESFWKIGRPAMRKRGMTATVFLVSDLVGRLNEWDLALGDVEEPLMDRDQVLALQAQGFEFGSHTCRHVDLPKLSSEAAAGEIRRSKDDLEGWLGRPVDFFCYPYGGENGAIRSLVREAGYRGATTTQLHGNGPDTDPFGWGRINVRHNHSAFRLMRRLLKARR